MDCKVDLSGAVLPLKDSFPGATVGFLSRVNPVRYKKKKATGYNPSLFQLFPIQFSLILNLNSKIPADRLRERRWPVEVAATGSCCTEEDNWRR